MLPLPPLEFPVTVKLPEPEPEPFPLPSMFMVTPKFELPLTAPDPLADTRQVVTPDALTEIE
jgi:hypothetical protein